jgi:hypothetical protein
MAIIAIGSAIQGPSDAGNSLPGSNRTMNGRAARLPVLIAGGGIGDLAAALALVRQGLAVKVLEQKRVRVPCTPTRR